MSDIIIERIHQDHICTLGKIIINGSLEGFSLEPPWVHNQQNISCIPQGVYPYHKYMSEKYNRQCIALHHIPGREFISIHQGNKPEETEGCILPGRNIGVSYVKDSNLGLDDILERIDGLGFITIKGGF